MKHKTTLTTAMLIVAAFAFALAAEEKKGDPAAEQRKNYPTDTCVVSDEKLGGSMGAPYEHMHEGRLVMLCCKGCVKDFQKNPAKYLKKLDDALAKQKSDKAKNPPAPKETPKKSEDGHNHNH